MMKILQRYIAKVIIAGTALATAVITAIVVLMLLLGELKDLGEGDYGIFQVVIYVLMKLPNELYQYSPMLVMLGSIISLSMLSANKEIAVMRTSGFSIRQIMTSVLVAALILILGITLVGEWAGPTLSYKAEIRKENAENAGQAVITASGVWYHIDNNFIHIDRVMDRQLLEGVTRYQFDNDHQLITSYYAKKMLLEDGGWVMHDVVETRFFPDRTKSKSIEQMPLLLQLNTNLFNIGLVDPSEMSLHKLAKFTRYLEDNGLQSAQYRYQFWQRLLQPLSSLVMVFLVLPFVLGAMGKSSLGFRMLIAIVAGFIFFISNALLGEISTVYQFPALFAALLPPLLFIVVGIYLSNRLTKI